MNIFFCKNKEVLYTGIVVIVACLLFIVSLSKYEQAYATNS